MTVQQPVKPLASLILVLALSLVLAACGESSIDPPDEAASGTSAVGTNGDDSGGGSDGAQTAEQAERIERNSARSDLKLTITGPAEPVRPGEIYEFTITVEALDASQSSGTSVLLELSGLEYVGDLGGCLHDPTGAFYCLVPQGPNPDDWGTIYFTDGPGILAVPFLVTAEDGEVEITGTVTSENNGLDNDPNPSNNIATASMTVAATDATQPVGLATG